MGPGDAGTRPQGRAGVRAAGPGRRLVGAAAAVALCCGAAACGQAPAAPQASPLTLPPLASWPQASATVAWTAPVAAPQDITVAPDASAVAGISFPAGGGQSPWAFAADGALVPMGAASGGSVYALSGGLIVVGPGVADPPGTASIFSAVGAVLWQGPAVGPIAAASDASGSRFAIVDSGTGQATEWAAVPGGGIHVVPSPGLAHVGPSASLQFDDAGDALVVDAEHAALYGPAGQTRWSVPLSSAAPPRSLVVDRGGAGVTAATAATASDGDTLYQFVVGGDGRPSVVWSQPLAPGGANRLVAGPESRVAVIGVGGTATLAVYRDSDGSLLWEDTVPAPPGSDGGSPVVASMAFTAGGDVVAAVDGCDATGAPCLLLLDGNGRAVCDVQLPAGSSVTLAGNGLAAVVVLPPARAGAPAAVEWLDLGGLWPGASGS